MRPLPAFSLKKYYGIEDLELVRVSSDLQYPVNISTLINSFARIKSPSLFRHRFMELIQVFFDSVTDSSPQDKMERKDAKEVALQLLQLGKEVVGTFYRGENINFDSVCQKLYKHETELQTYLKPKFPNKHHLENRLDLIQRVGFSVQREPFQDIDSLVCVANGGFEPALLVADILEKNVVLPVRFSNYNKHNDPDSKPKISNIFTSGDIRKFLEGKRVLVIEDLVCSGESLMKVMQYVQRRDPYSVIGISARISEYYLHNYPPKRIYLQDAETHQFTLNSDDALQEIVYEDRSKVFSELF